MKEFTDIPTPGTQIKFNLNGASGYISGVIIRKEGIAYEISYFVDGIHYTTNFDDFEFECINSDKTKIGFKNKVDK